MVQVTLGRTGITVNKNGFGALPIQRIPKQEAVRLVRMAYEGGMTFFDTARAYTDSEEKIGAALSGIRENVYIATKTQALTGAEMRRDLEISLKNLQTDYVDLLQFHTPPFCPKPDDGSGLYEAAAEAVQAGKVRHIGITNHRLHIAHEAVDSGLYETLQFPLCYLATDKDLALVTKCAEQEVGFIAMKALSGGMLTNSAAAYAYLAQFDNVLPIWGIQRESELREFLSYVVSPPEMNEEMLALIQKDRKELLGDFCRSCGYCMPCPQGIEISNCARISQLIRRSPSDAWLSEQWQRNMKMTETCVGCGVCMSRCPYSLNIPELLRKNYVDYQEILAGKIQV